MKNSTELIAAAREAARQELQCCLDKEMNPSLTRVWLNGWSQGVTDAKDLDCKPEPDWHYVKYDGLPPIDEKVWVMIEYDKYYDTMTGYCDETGAWHIDWAPNSHWNVIAWHGLPDIPKELIKQQM